jgi:hypothetical protein
MRDDDDLGAWSEFGTADGLAAIHGAEAMAAGEGFGDATDVGYTTGFGAAPGGWAGESATAHVGFGAAPDLDGLAPVTAPFGEAAVEAAGLIGASSAPAGYHNQVDADGDGHVDHATYRGDGHGGVEILVDLNHDGRADFIGHDTDLDNRVDYADYDKNHDGVFEEREYDTNHDGILDRVTWLHDS